MFTTDKIGDTMKAAISRTTPKSGSARGTAGSSVMARSYTTEKLAGYLRSFYTDDNRETGWNNLVSLNIGMPHVLNELSGPQSWLKRCLHGRRQRDQDRSRRRQRRPSLLPTWLPSSTIPRRRTARRSITTSSKPSPAPVRGAMNAQQYDAGG